MQQPPYHRFDEFIAPEADRLALLTSILREMGIVFSIAEIAGNRHVLVYPEWGQGARKSPASTWQTDVVLSAHYDRVPGSPGANDNSAAVFQLIETAVKLREQRAERWLIIFTDKEELARGERVQEQGSYTLAKNLREAGLGNSWFFIFDACGAGDTLIISTMVDHLIKDEHGPGIVSAKRRVQQLRTRALETARKLGMDRILLTAAPFSDDAGFLRAGIAAQTITVLPAAEAARLVSLLRNKPECINALISREAQEHQDRLRIPETWRSLNGPGDGIDRLTPENYKQVVRFACALCGGD
ncbi:hypothetical protein FACS189444_5610 [Spirochaetia bacterium]|nr:hypothetical protein FACS189444_5610 [Spirochaetia bacterium]